MTQVVTIAHGDTLTRILKTKRGLKDHEIHAWLRPMTREMFQQVGPEDAYILARLVQALQEAGGSVDTDDLIKMAGYGVGGVSGLAASGDMARHFAKQYFQAFRRKMAKIYQPLVDIEQTPNWVTLREIYPWCT